jgi:zinc protease
VIRSMKLLAAVALVAIVTACAAEKVKSLKQAEAEAMAQDHAQPAPAAPPPAPVAAPPAVPVIVDTPPPAKTSAPAKPVVTETTLPSANPAPMVAPPAPAAPPPGPKPVVSIAAMTLPADSKAGVSIALRFRTGSIDDPQGKFGITNLAARVMAEGGAGSYDAKTLLEALFPIAADVRVRVDREQTTFIAHVHRDALDKLLPIFTSVLTQPRWDRREFARIRESVVSEISKSLRQARDEDLGKEALAELMYRGHPYGHLIEGHVRDLNSMTLDEVRAHAQRVFTLDRLTIGVSGGYPEALPAKLQTLLQSLPSQSEPTPFPSMATGVRHPKILLVEKQSASTAISIGTPWALGHGDADWAALSIARSAIGEHRQSNGRLMQRLREMRGLNYGDYAYIEFFKQEGGDASTAQTGRARHQQDFTLWLRPMQNENRLFALRAALYELDRSLHDEPFSGDEVARSKGFLDGYLLLFDQTDARKLGYALDDQLLGQTNFLRTWRQSLDGIDAAQVNEAWRKWVHPEELQIVMAGPGMAALKAEILANTPSPMHYKKGSTQSEALLGMDAKISSYPLQGISDADIEVISVDKLFE